MIPKLNLPKIFASKESDIGVWVDLLPIAPKSEVFHLTMGVINIDEEAREAKVVLRAISPRDANTDRFNLLKSITQNLQDGLFRTTENGRFLYANDAFCKMFGFESLNEIAKLKSLDFYVDPDQRIEFQKLLASKGVLKNVEVLLKRIDGNIFWGLISVSISKDPVGDIYYDGSIRDVTELKHIERQLKIEIQKAEEASRAKEMFLSTMSHELKTTMNAVIGMTHLLLASDPKPSQEENLKTLQFSAENLLHIINDILDFSKIEAGKIELESERFSQKDLLSHSHMTESFKPKAAAKELDLIIEVGEGLNETYIGDHTRLSQILNNLISNAIKFTYHGKVLVRAELKRNAEAAHLVHFLVTDTGIGIPENKRQMIFGMFTQANSNTTRKYGGTGLGLTISKRLVELHDSNLHLESMAGQGSTFHFDILFTLNDQQQLQPKKDLVSSKNGGMTNALVEVKVLIVEDNEVNQILLKKFAQIWGAQIAFAENGLEATQVVEEYDPDIILMDLQMPIMDGYAASKIIRSILQFSTTPILAVTASVLLDVHSKITEAGMTDYVCKPFKPEDLLQKIKQLLADNIHKSSPSSSD